MQRLGADGSFGEPVAGFGVRAGRLYRPKGVAVDARGRIWVSDSYLGVVQVFGPDGAFLAVLGDERRRVRRFESPLGLAFGPRGRLHVVEMRKDRVRVLELTGAGGKP